jgi:hypothetical protein
MMSTSSADHNSSAEAPAVSSADASASSGEGGSNPVWLMVGAGALFFAFAAALLASG